MFGNVMQPMGGQQGGGMQLPQSMPNGPLWGLGRPPMGGPLGQAGMGALGGLLRGMTPNLPINGVMNAMGGGAVNPQLLAALLGR